MIRAEKMGHLVKHPWCKHEDLILQLTSTHFKASKVCHAPVSPAFGAEGGKDRGMGFLDLTGKADSLGNLMIPG